MKSAELMRKLPKAAKARGVKFTSVPGKGSHFKVSFGDRRTIIPQHNKELGQGLLRAILKDLGLKEDDLS
jgi:mRNA interferase HicA